MNRVDEMSEHLKILGERGICPKCGKGVKLKVNKATRGKYGECINPDCDYTTKGE